MSEVRGPAYAQGYGAASGRAKPSEEEKKLLDEELEDYSRNRDAGTSWEGKPEVAPGKGV